MKLEWSEQYLVRCVVLEAGDDIDDVLDTAVSNDCTVPEDGEDCYCVRFPERNYPELYTESALRRSFPIRTY